MLLKLVQAGLVDPAIRPGRGRGKGRAGLWRPTSVRQLSAWCRLRKAGLRSKRLAFALWWEVGKATPQGRAYLEDSLAVLAQLHLSGVFGKRVPTDAAGRKAAVRRYIARTAPSPSPADFFGKDRGYVEFATIAGALGLLRQERPPADQVSKVLPRLTASSRATLPSDLTSFVSQHASAFGLLLYALSPYASLKELRRSLDLLIGISDGLGDDDRSARELLREVRVYLRNGAAWLLRQPGYRRYWRIWRKSLIPWVATMAGSQMPRSFAPYRRFLTQEGVLAILVLVLLLVHRTMLDAGMSEGLRELNRWNWEVRPDAGVADATGG